MTIEFLKCANFHNFQKNNIYFKNGKKWPANNHLSSFAVFYVSDTLCATLSSQFPSLSQFHQHFTYKFFVRTSFFYVHVTRKSCQNATFVWKICMFNVDEIYYLSQFHQNFKCKFCIQKQIEQLFSSYVQLCNFLVPKYWRKMRA